MSEPKQNISKFVKGMENKLYDKVKKASSETIAQNGFRDKKCTGFIRKVSGKCCSWCSEREGHSSKERAREIGATKLHKNGCCIVTPDFDINSKEEFKLTREMINDKKFGKKVAEHAHEFGLDVKEEKDRERFIAIILSIVNSPEEVVEGTWRDKPKGVTYYIKGDDVVVMDGQNFITILRDGVSQNERVKSARLKR